MLTQARANCINASTPDGKTEAENQLSKTLKTLFAVAENYPDLKASQNFLKLQEQLAELEDQLQMARRYYNGTVRDFNIAVQSFPDLLLARIAGFREQPFFETDDAAVPSIKLTSP